VPDERRSLLFDPQTSGGLLIAIHESRANELVRRMRENGIADAAVCGEVFASDKPILEIKS
jgi:selenide,water dikinase